MTVSELIRKLSEAQKKHGDLPVFVEEWGEHSVRKVMALAEDGSDLKPGEKAAQIFLK